MFFIGAEIDWRWRWFKITWGYRLGRIVCLFKGHKWYQYADPNDPMQQPYLYDRFCERCLKFGTTPSVSNQFMKRVFCHSRNCIEGPRYVRRMRGIDAKIGVD